MKGKVAFLIFLLLISILGAEEKLPIKPIRQGAGEGIKRFGYLEIYRHGRVEKFQIAEYLEDLGYINKKSISVFITKLEELESQKSYKNYTILKANFQNLSLGTVLYSLAKLTEKNVIFGKELWKERSKKVSAAEVKIYTIQSGETQQLRDEGRQTSQSASPTEEFTQTESSNAQTNKQENVNKQLRKSAELVETYSIPTYLLQPVNLIIERPIHAYTLFKNILREYELIAIKLSRNLLKVSIKSTIEFSLDTDNKEVITNFINQLKKYVSPAAHIIYDKGLNKIIITDLKENIDKLKDMKEDFYSLLRKKTKESNRINKKTISRVFYFSNKKDLELARNILKDFSKELSFSEDKDFNALVVIGNKEIIEKISSKLENISYRQSLESIITTRIFYVRYITPEKIKNMIKPFLSENGEVYILSNYDIFQKQDFQKDKISVKGASNLEENAFGDINKERESKLIAKNAIIIKDYPERIDKIYKKFKKFLSEKPMKIVIRARFVELQKSILRELGINWNLNFSKAYVPEFWSSNTSFQQIAGKAQGLLAFTFQKGRLNLLDLRLRAYEKENKARTIAEPYVLTSNGEPAVVAAGLEWPVFRLNITQQLTQITWNYIRIPLTLIATPILLPDGNILLDITLTRKQIIDFFRFPVTQDVTQDIPILSTSRIDIKVPVKNGETIVIGGILEKSDSNTESGIPGLRRIPLLGWLFKEQIKELKDRELLIFLTPEIVEE